MKVGFYGLKGKEISLISIILVSTTFIIWSWERAPGRASFVSSQTLMQFSSEILSSVLDEYDGSGEVGISLDNATENRVCNLAKGKWVPDNRRPLYSGFECKQWLSEMWACRLTQRTDFAYERLRWQPKDCQVEEFEGSKFLRRMQHKTLAFVGDSLGRQQFQSLMCMITAGKETRDVEDVGKEYGLILSEGAARPDGWAYRFLSTNTTILYYWSAILCDIEPINVDDPATEYAIHLDRPPAFLHQFLHKFNVLVLNTGHHWNRGKINANRWIMHVGGVPNTDKKIAVVAGAKNLTVHNVVRWVNSQLLEYPSLKVFFRTISPRHFVGGDWNTGGSCNSTTPMSVGKEILGEESTDKVVANAVKGTRVKILDITALSQLRDEGHISHFSISAKPGVQDCLHWCLPGIPDTWNEILFTQI
ncbi:protein trichome birefringence-like 16 [Vigna unguiculata]|uniref:PC-Esterase n=1 Tax=Vigna unguiculata TaxID=3917 RepID=A0A4D6NLP2_VIGUN|nr:protein trichome birefringence-like 16 [Vigna unguiculata]QCE13584.1 PC-Esterase [Vigna unguiculata]